MNKLPLTPLLLVATLFAAVPALSAEPVLTYSGRLTAANGKPLSGTYDVDLRFFGSAQDADQLGPTYPFPELRFVDGIFQVPLTMSGSEQNAVFGDYSTPVYVEVTIAGKVYPRQRFIAAPYALRIPIDNKTLRYDDASGKLTVGPAAAPAAGEFLTKDGSGNLVWATPSGAASSITGKPINATAPTNGQFLQYDGTEWKSTSLSLTSGNVTTALGYTPLNKAGDVMTGTFGLAAMASDPTGLGGSDKGKVWFNTTSGEIKYWNGSAAVALGAAGSGLANLSGETGTSQTLSVGSAGNSPAWTHATNDHTLNIPMANAGASVTAGLLSNADYAAFNAKQAALGYTPVNKAGDVLTGALGLAAFASDPAGLTALDAGKVWFNSTTGQVKYWDGSSAKVAGTTTITTTDIANGTILDADINATAGIAATKLAGGAVDNIEFGYLDGVTSSIQTQINGKAPSAHSHGNAEILAGVDAAKISGGAVSNAEFDYLDGVTSAIQTQINSKAASSHTHGNADIVAGVDAAKISGGTVSNTEFDYLDGVTSAIQTQLNGKQAALGFTPLNKAGDAMTGTFGLASLASDPAGLVAGDKGKVWYNSTTGEVKYWNGSAAVALGAAGAGLGNLSGETGSSQTLTTGTSGNAPAWVHASNDHKFNIPMANAGASVTAGLISNADYVSFGGKQAALGYTPVNRAGDVMSGALGLAAFASDPAGLTALDAGKVWFNSTSGQVKYWDGSAAVVVGTNTVGSSEITDGSIMDADINAAAGIVDTKLATISTAGKVSGSAITSGTIGGSTVINTSGGIATSGVLSSGSLGVGTTAPAYPIQQVNQLTGTGINEMSNRFLTSVNAGTTTTSNYNALDSYFAFTNAATGDYTGAVGRAASFNVVNTNTLIPLGTANPVASWSQTGASATTNKVVQYWSGLDVAATGAVGTRYGLWMTDPTGTGSITSQTGVAIGSLTRATNNTSLLLGTTTIPAGNFAIHSATTYPSYFNGKVGIGSTAPAYELDVTGTIRATGGFIGGNFNDASVNNLSNLGIGTTAPSGDLSFGGAVARTIQSDRNTTAAAGGKNLTVAAGGTKSGDTDGNGGNLVLASGVATGSGSSMIQFQTAGGGSSGTADSTPSTKMTILGNGNVGIGTTAPIAPLQVGTPTPTLTNLGETPAVIAGGNQGFYAIPASAGRGFITETTDFANGTVGSKLAIGLGATTGNTFGQIQASTAGTASTGMLAINPSGGNVGIGTTNPGARFEVLGTGGNFARFTRSSVGTGHNYVSIYNPDTTDGNADYIRFQSDTTGTGAAVAQDFGAIGGIFDVHEHATRAGGLAFRTLLNGVQADSMVLSKNGYLGLGTITPSVPLSLYKSGGTNLARITQNNSSAVADAALQVVNAHSTGSALDLGHFFQTSNDWLLRAYGNVGRGESDVVSTTGAPVFKFGVRADGNVGIGTAVPASPLSVGSTSGFQVDSNGNIVKIRGATTSFPSSNASGVLTNDGSGNLSWGTGSQWTTSGSDISYTAGKVGIGTTSPSSPLTVVGNASISSALTARTITLGPPDSTGQLDINRYGDTDAIILRNTANGVAIGTGIHFMPGQAQASIAKIAAITDSSSGNTNPYLQFMIRSSGALSEAMRITTSGALGIGTTSPASLLSVGSGSPFQVNSTGNLTKINNVTYSWPSANGAADTFLKTDASGNLSWSTSSISAANVAGITSGQLPFGTGTGLSGSTNLVWDNTNGRLGVGAASPSAIVDIRRVNDSDGDVMRFGSQSWAMGRLGEDSSTNTVYMANTYANLSMIDFRIAGSAAANSVMKLSTTNVNVTPKLNVGSSGGSGKFTVMGGNVGIGIVNPTTFLDVRRSDNSDGDAVAFGSQGYVMGRLGEDSSTNRVYVANTYASGSYFDVRLGGSTPDKTKMTVTVGGNVGIGTTAPGTMLELAGYSSAGVLSLDSGDNNLGGIGNAQIAFGYNGTRQYPHFIRTRHAAGTSSNNAIDFYTSDGTAGGTFPTNAVLGLSINGGNVGVGTTAATAKLQVAGQIATNIPTTMTPTGTAQTIDWSLGNIQVLSLASATGTVTASFSNAVAGASYAIRIIQGATARNITWPAAVKWPGGSAPTITTTASAVDMVTLFYDGTYYWAAAGQDYK